MSCRYTLLTLLLQQWSLRSCFQHHGGVAAPCRQKYNRGGTSILQPPRSVLGAPLSVSQQAAGAGGRWGWAKRPAGMTEQMQLEVEAASQWLSAVFIPGADEADLKDLFCQQLQASPAAAAAALPASALPAPPRLDGPARPF
jgi:hypothetical protein